MTQNEPGLEKSESRSALLQAARRMTTTKPSDFWARQSLDVLLKHDWLRTAMPGWIHGASVGGELTDLPEANRYIIPSPRSLPADARHGDWVPKRAVPAHIVEAWTKLPPELKDFAFVLSLRDDGLGRHHRIYGIGVHVGNSSVPAPHAPGHDCAKASEWEYAPLAFWIPRPQPEQVAHLVREFGNARVNGTSRALAAHGIAAQTLADPRFHNTLRVDADARVLFPYVDSFGVTGLRREPALDLTQEGSKSPCTAHGVWHSRAVASDRRLVVTTSPVEALSYHQLNPRSDTRYLATGKLPTREQLKLLERAVAKMPAGSEIVAATSNSPGTYYLAIELKQITHGRPVEFQHELAQKTFEWGAADWNSELRARTPALERDRQGRVLSSARGGELER